MAAVAIPLLVVVVVVVVVGAAPRLRRGRRPADAARPVSIGSFRRNRSFLSCSSS